MLKLEDICVRERVAGKVLLDVPRLDIAPGDRVAVMGPSGAGKSLLLSALTGRTPAAVRMTGTRRASAELKRIGFVPQRGLDALHPLVPVRTQLKRITGASAERVAHVLVATGLPTALHRRRPAELSGGQAQRAAVALAVLTGAGLVIADEPTSALDPRTRDETLAMLESLLPATTALVIATHDPAVAAALAGRRIDVNAGQIDVRPVPASDRVPLSKTESATVDRQPTRSVDQRVAR